MGRDPARHRRLAGPEAETAGDVGVGETLAALGEKQGPLAWIVGQRPPAALHVALQCPLRRLADRQDPLLRPLAHHPQLLALEIERALVEVDDLLAAQPA